MKKIILYITTLTFFGCSTSTDSNGNSTTIIIPIPPTNLSGQVVSNTQINLSWIDNSTNELGFKIERKSGAGVFAEIGNVNANTINFNDVGLSPNTSYTYRIYAFNTVGNSPIYSNEVTLNTSSQTGSSLITTTNLSGITSASALCGGTISTTIPNQAVSSRGVIWSTSPNPGLLSIGSKTTDGIGTGTFESLITGLTANTTYYVRAYAVYYNSGSLNANFIFGNELVLTTLQNGSLINVLGTDLTDIDGNIYHSIRNCNQTWMQSNLNVSHYRNGDIIPQVTDPTQWNGLTTGAWCYMNNDPINGQIYGKLYNWYAVNDPRGLAPAGWHIPTEKEWQDLIFCLDPNTPLNNYDTNTAGGKMKEMGTSHWANPNNSATNSSGWNALPGGFRDIDGWFSNPQYYPLNYEGLWWTSKLQDNNPQSTIAVGFGLYYNGAGVIENGGGIFKKGESVRCIKD